MKLQIATDIANTETVFSIADAVHDVIAVSYTHLIRFQAV